MSGKGPRFGGFTESHLMPDAIAAFVDAELSRTARARAQGHLDNCSMCTTEVAQQQCARDEVRAADRPRMSESFLAALCEIPAAAELPATPPGFAMTDTGQLVQIQRPDRVATTRLMTGAVIGDSVPLGMRDSLGTSLGDSRSVLSKRAVHGAGMLMSGVMLGALTLVTPHALAQGPTEGADAAAAAVDRNVPVRAAVEIEPSRPLTHPIHGMMVGHF